MAQFTDYESPVSGDHLAHEIVVVIAIHKGTHADGTTHGSHRLTDGTFAVRPAAKSLLGIQADHDLGTHEGSVGGQGAVGQAIMVVHRVRSESTTATAGSPTIVGTTGPVGGLAARTATVRNRECSKTVAALRSRLGSEEGTCSTTTAATVPGGARFGLERGVQGLHSGVVTAADREAPLNHHLAAGKNSQWVRAQDHHSGARLDPEVTNINDAIDHRLRERRNPSRATKDLGRHRVEDHRFGATKAHDPIKVAARSTGATKIKTGPQEAVFPGRRGLG